MINGARRLMWCAAAVLAFHAPVLASGGAGNGGSAQENADVVAIPEMAAHVTAQPESAPAEQPRSEPLPRDAKRDGGGLILNGDNFEYAPDDRTVSIQGNVEILYKGARLTCEKIKVDTETKEATADGRVRLIDEQGSVTGSRVLYNFETKRGTISEAGFMAYPYFGKAASVERIADNEFIAHKGYASTCSYDRPHYRLGARKVRIVPGEKIQTAGTSIFVAGAPVMALPSYSHSLKDRIMHGRLIPGRRKDWGAYLLSSWRYNLRENIDARLYADYRSKLGWAEGFGLNYRTADAGQGDFKFYVTEEHPVTNPPGDGGDYQRYLARWRHNWAIDERSRFVSEVYKIGDERRKVDPGTNFLKDYFYREFEKDSEPLTYGLYHRNFEYSSLDVLTQVRSNKWFDQIEKTPDVQFSLPQVRVAGTPVYFSHTSSAGNYDKKASTAPVTSAQEDSSRFDTLNKLSLPLKAGFVELTPFAAERATLYDKGADGRDLPLRAVFYTGADASTKLYRTYGGESRFLGMEINSLRHVITPTVGYAYNHDPSIAPSDLRQIDAVDAVVRGHAATVGLSNKLQTKRSGASVDVLDTRVSTAYNIQQETASEHGSSFSDILFEATALPYPWLRFDGDALYNRSGPRSAEAYKKFIAANYDLGFTLARERVFGFGQRYERGGSNQLTYSLNWRLNPKWRFAFYNRYEIGNDVTLAKGLKEQEYTISRDLHCWEMDFSVNLDKTQGNSFWVVLRLKAFPEAQFDINQSLHQPESGAQAAP